ncbi:pentatricopeptide repeat-containing protein [Pyrus ussuriensis x Pyrus communis]|uniref:Pentatricopeptide repeat-containing protein n=1 Tax=Pyrus ussuriensis x Pyrus communis TaxID=2448454 RepID=A0A5N5FJ76_9ROSA|nr:pentatricopeptide repeat-containing protein [Pyrus ussuriensis x Pyrus communis]
MQSVAFRPLQSVEAQKKNRIQVSNNKKPPFFYETHYSGSDCGGFFDSLIMAVGQLLAFALLAWKWLLFVQDCKSWELSRL